MSTGLKVEYSLSSRAKCKKCKEKIEKKEIRIQIVSEGGDFNFVSYKHLDCFPVTRKYADTDPTQIDGYDQLEEEDQKKVQEHFTNPGKKQQSNKKVEKSSVKFDQNENDQDQEDTNKKSYRKSTFLSDKMIGYTNEQFDQYEDLLDSLKDKITSQLKDICKLNDQKISGTKSDLITRVADGIVLGQIPNCPTCFGGKLDFDYIKGTYKCKGYWDDDYYVQCRKVYNFHEISRQEWIN